MNPPDFIFFFHSLPAKQQLNLGFIFFGLTLILLLFLYCISRCMELNFADIASNKAGWGYKQTYPKL